VNLLKNDHNFCSTASTASEPSENFRRDSGDISQQIPARENTSLQLELLTSGIAT